MSQPLGKLGRNESAPTIVNWRWYYHLPNLAVWLVAVTALVVTKVSNTRRDWLVVIALVLSFVLWQMEGFGVLVAILALAWIVVWMTSPRRTPYSAV